MRKNPVAWKAKLYCGCGLTEVIGGECEPYACLMDALKAYQKPDGFLILTSEDENGQFSLKCYAKDPGKATPSIPPDSVLRIGPPRDRFSPADQARALMDWLHLCRKRRLLQEDLDKSEAGDPAAHERVIDTVNDYQRLRFGRAVDSVKGKPDHLALLMIGRAFGLYDLNANELTCCFDATCPCGSHDADSLERLRRWTRQL